MGCSGNKKTVNNQKFSYTNSRLKAVQFQQKVTERAPEEPDLHISAAEVRKVGRQPPEH